MKMNDKLYDILKWVSLVALDAIGVAYKGLAECWGWGFGTEVMTTCAILSALIGTLIGVSSVAYHKQEAIAAKELLDDEAIEIFPEESTTKNDPDGYLKQFVENAPEADDTGNIDGGEV